MRGIQIGISSWNEALWQSDQATYQVAMTDAALPIDTPPGVVHCA